MRYLVREGSPAPTPAPKPAEAPAVPASSTPPPAPAAKPDAAPSTPPGQAQATDTRGTAGSPPPKPATRDTGAPVTAPVPPAAPPTRTSSKPASPSAMPGVPAPSGPSPTPAAPSTPAPSASGLGPLAEFLEKNRSLYNYSGIISATSPDPSQIASALSAYAIFVDNRKSTSAAYAFNSAPLGQALSSIVSLKSVGPNNLTSDNVSLWKGAQILNENFTSDISGLIAFLKFAYVATRGRGVSGYTDANSIGLLPDYVSYFPKDPAYRAACKVGGISSFPLMLVRLPSEGVNEGDALFFSLGSPAADADRSDASFTFSRTISGGVLLSAGIEAADTGQAGNSITLTTANFSGEAFKKIVQSFGSTITFRLSASGRVYENSVNGFDLGTVVDFKDAQIVKDRPPSPQTAAELSGADTTKDTYTRGGSTGESRILTEEGARTFTLENVYIDQSGAPRLNPVAVEMRKEIRGKRDVFILDVQSPGTDSILIPIQLSAVLAEARHWTQLTGPVPARAGGISHIPMRRIEWQYGGNYIKYGVTGTPRILLVSGVPSDVTPEGAEVSIVSAAEANAQGRGDGEFDPVETAILRYISTDQNPTGVALYLTRTLNQAMNSFQRATYISG